MGERRAPAEAEPARTPVRRPTGKHDRLREPHTPAALAAADAGSRAHAVARLQQTAGNASVQRLVRPAPEVLVQRYEAGEHAQFGGDLLFTIKEMKLKTGAPLPDLTEGEVIALGDFYESPGELLEANPDELNKLVELIRRDRKHFEGGPEKAVTSDEWEDATKGRKKGKRYLDLAAKNAPHFAAPAGTTGFEEGEDDNRSKWFKHFKQAIELAQDKKMGEALLTNAFAAHFLTDAFSSGHLINKAATVAKAHKSPAKDEKERDKDKRIDDEATRLDFEKRIARGILADPKGAVLNGYQARTSAWNVVFGGGWTDMSEDTLAGVVDVIWYHEEEKFFSMFVRAVHDRLNKDISEGSGGIEVMNKMGDKWRLSGDETLSKSPDTLAAGKKAVDRAREAVKAAEGKGPLDIGPIAQSVWNFVPFVTAEGQKQIDAAESELLDPKKKTASDAWIAVALENFNTLLAQLTEKDLIKPKPKVEPAPKKPKPALPDAPALEAGPRW